MYTSLSSLRLKIAYTPRNVSSLSSRILRRNERSKCRRRVLGCFTSEGYISLRIEKRATLRLTIVTTKPIIGGRMSWNPSPAWICWDNLVHVEEGGGGGQEFLQIFYSFSGQQLYLNQSNTWMKRKTVGRMYNERACHCPGTPKFNLGRSLCDRSFLKLERAKHL